LKEGGEIAAKEPLTEAKYYRVRSDFNRLPKFGPRSFDDEPVRKLAEYFYLLNRSGFNGLYRVNTSGGFNVPWGRYKSGVPGVVGCARELKNIRFACQSWEETIGCCTDDFIYSDPPYDDGFTDYTENGFGWDQQVLLAAYLAVHRGPVVASNKATPRIVALYKAGGLKVRYVNGPRRIACNGNRKPEREILAIKNL